MPFTLRQVNAIYMRQVNTPSSFPGEEPMASIWPLHSVVFDPDAVKVLAASYEQACRFAGNPSVPTKELFAKRILQAAKRGERDVEKLTECALVGLAGGMADAVHLGQHGSGHLG
jgi:hypothetical protein